MGSATIFIKLLFHWEKWWLTPFSIFLVFLLSLIKMKFFLATILTLLYTGMFARTIEDTTLNQLFDALSHKAEYTKAKEQRIADLKKLLEMPDITDNQRYNLYNKIQDEYRPYQIDSATIYLQKNLTLAQKLQNAQYIADTKLTLCFMYWQSGKFFEAIQLLGSINRKQLDSMPTGTLRNYYNSYKRLYLYYAEAQNEKDNEYYHLSRLYADSLVMISTPETQDFSLWLAEKYTYENRTKEAIAILNELLAKSHNEDHNRAILSSILANVYKKAGVVELQKKYYALSAIYDIKNAVKENSSMQALALLLYKEGDIDNAYYCIQSSMEDAVFCNSRFRTYEITKIFPIIDSAYQAKSIKQKRQLKLYLLLVSILSLMLVFAISSIFLYIKRIAYIRKELSQTNEKLKELNMELKTSNEQYHLLVDELMELNRKLSETNRVKETYLAKFIDLCSHYIEKLDNYRRTLNRFAKDGKMNELYGELNSSHFINNELSNFFANFDETFLRLYPSFIDQFNSLFPEDERMSLKPGEILNPELRIYALIKLGINDSSQIALFLRFSITTVYTYRSKLKNKSLFKETFEDQVLKIGQ